MFLVGIFHSWWFKGAFGWNQTDSKCFSSGLYIGIIYAAHRSEWHHCQGRRQVMVKMDSGLTAVVCPPGVDTAVFLHPAQGRWGKVEEKNQQKGAQRIKPGFQKLLRSYTRKKTENACLAPTMIYVLCPQGGRAFSDTVWSPWAGLPGRFVWKPTGVGPLPTLSQWWIQQEKKKISKVASVWSLGRFGFRSFSATICETWFFQIRRSVFNSQTLSCMFLCFSPPVRWGLLDFMSVSSPPSSSSSPSSPSSFSSINWDPLCSVWRAGPQWQLGSSQFSVACWTPIATGILSVQCGMPDHNRDPMSSVWRAGPQPRYCEFSVACWTPTAMLWVQCGVLDPNRDSASSVWRPGPQPRYCEFSVAAWTPTAILGVQCGVVDPNRDPVSSVWRAGPQVLCQKICQKEWQKICQKEWQKICQKKCQKDMSEEMSERMSKDMSERCQKECQKICQKECQKICQKEW